MDGKRNEILEAQDSRIECDREGLDVPLVLVFFCNNILKQNHNTIIKHYCFEDNFYGYSYRKMID